MARFKVVGSEARSRLVKSQDTVARQNFWNDVVKGITKKGLIVEPSEGESLRSLRVQLSRAANRLGVKLIVSEENNVVVAFPK